MLVPEGDGSEILVVHARQGKRKASFHSVIVRIDFAMIPVFLVEPGGVLMWSFTDCRGGTCCVRDTVMGEDTAVPGGATCLSLVACKSSCNSSSRRELCFVSAR